MCSYDIKLNNYKSNKRKYIEYLEHISNNKDIQKIWHVDTFHSTFKFWFYIEDINEKENFLYTGNIFACNNSLNEEFKTRIIQISENAI